MVRLTMEMVSKVSNEHLQVVITFLDKKMTSLSQEIQGYFDSNADRLLCQQGGHHSLTHSPM